MSRKTVSVQLQPHADQNTQQGYAAFLFLYAGYSRADIEKLLVSAYGTKAISDKQIRAAILNGIDQFKSFEKGYSTAG